MTTTLKDLDAEFVDGLPDGSLSFGPKAGQGVLFDDPLGGGSKICVWFANPIGGGAPAGPQHLPAPRWQRTGETIETLTLAPSVNVRDGWHGWVHGGVVTSC